MILFEPLKPCVYASKLNESDLIVKENDRLKKLNSDLQKSEQNARQEAMTEVSAVKEECAKRERIAESKAQEADKLKSHLEAVEADLSGQIDKKALNLVESKLNALQGVYEAKQRSLDSEYKALTVSHEGFLFGCLLYGILVTVFTAIRSKAFTGDFKTFFITVGNFFMWCGKSLYWLGIQASKLGDMIPQPIVATIVHWLLFIIACFGVAIVLVILAFLYQLGLLRYLFLLLLHYRYQFLHLRGVRRLSRLFQLAVEFFQVRQSERILLFRVHQL